MADTRGVTEATDQPATTGPPCPTCAGHLEQHGIAWSCHACRQTMLLARCSGCGDARWSAGQLPPDWIEIRAGGTFAPCCSAACAVLLTDRLAAAGLVALTPSPPPAPPSRPLPDPAS